MPVQKLGLGVAFRKAGPFECEPWHYSGCVAVLSNRDRFVAERRRQQESIAMFIGNLGGPKMNVAKAPIRH